MEPIKSKDGRYWFKVSGPRSSVPPVFVQPYYSENLTFRNGIGSVSNLVVARQVVGDGYIPILSPADQDQLDAARAASQQVQPNPPSEPVQDADGPPQLQNGQDLEPPTDPPNQVSRVSRAVRVRIPPRPPADPKG